jgi:probable F420-dependent oxidoreductase
MVRLRIGAKLPSSGGDPARLGIAAMASRLEDAGFDSMWVSDHVLMTEDTSRSHYPFGDDGSPGWSVDTPWYDALIVLAQAAAVTEHIELGTAVLVLPQRHPVVLAKQVASLDALAGGRVSLGVGAGWFREEFEALGVDFDARGRRFSEWLDLLRRCWQGRPAAFDGEHYRLPDGVIFEPTPARHVPLLIGGVSNIALRRAAIQGDGWLGLQRADRLDPGEVADAVQRMRAGADRAGRDPGELRVILRIIGSAGRSDVVAAAVPALVAAGVDEIVVDSDWNAERDELHVIDRLREAAQEEDAA